MFSRFHYIHRYYHKNVKHGIFSIMYMKKFILTNNKSGPDKRHYDCLDCQWCRSYLTLNVIITILNDTCMWLTTSHLNCIEIYFTASPPGQVSCLHNGYTLYPRGARLRVDECTECYCGDDGRTRCDIQSCPPPECESPLKLASQCCEVCPDSKY